MHLAGARVHRHEVRRDHARRAAEEWMLCFQARELVARHRRHFAENRQFRLTDKRLEQRTRDEEILRPAIAPKRREHVFLLRRHGDGHVRRKRPRRRRPDDHVRLAREFAADDRELHVDRRVRAVRVFHLRLGQRRLRARAPVHRLLRLINEPLFHELRKRPDDLRLIRRREREIRIRPVAEHAEALELPTLDVDELARVFLALAPHLDW